MTDKYKLRRQLLNARNQLSAADKIRLSSQIYQNIISHFDLSLYSNIASYHSFGKEVDLLPLLKHSNNIYLPVLQAKNIMQFCLFTSKENLQQNSFGIYEPQNTAIINPKNLELCFMPLVGFTRKGHRLGMGGGYYDRYFALNTFKQKPTILVGIAYDLQENATINSESWDIPLDLIITNKEVMQP